MQELLGGVGRLAANRSLERAGALALAIAAPLVLAILPTETAAQFASSGEPAVKSRNLNESRDRATRLPRSEGDQAMVEGWPLYRTERGQAAFNDAMATLKATDGPAPAADAFKGCTALECQLSLPTIGADGWIPAGRLWVSPTEYVLIAHSPRNRDGRSYRRRGSRDMRYFVFHEFHNGTRNIDPYDTISSHSGSVFVPFYMSKQGTDARGRRFVIVVQVAPYDVVSVHASNMGSNGPGIEVAKNVSDALEPLQGTAGILIASICKVAAPHLKVVNHRGSEGLPMLRAYETRLSAARSRSATPTLLLPFVPAPAQRVAAATARLDQLIVRRGASPPITMAERTFLPPKGAIPAPILVSIGIEVKRLSPLAAYLDANLAAMKTHPELAGIIPHEAAGVLEEAPEEGVVYLLDASRQTLGHIEAHQENGVVVRGKYVYLPLERVSEGDKPFALDLTRPLAVRSVALPTPRLIEPIRPAVRPAPAAGTGAIR
jgi:hypothetical protein